MERKKVVPKPPTKPTETKPAINLSEVKKPQIKRVDDKHAIRYRVVAETIDLVVLKEELRSIKTRLSELPEYPDDETLLAWARDNYPMMNYTTERKALLERLAELENLSSELGW